MVYFFGFWWPKLEKLILDPPKGSISVESAPEPEKMPKQAVSRYVSLEHGPTTGKFFWCNLDHLIGLKKVMWDFSYINFRKKLSPDQFHSPTKKSHFGPKSDFLGKV